MIIDPVARTARIATIGLKALDFVHDCPFLFALIESKLMESKLETYVKFFYRKYKTVNVIKFICGSNIFFLI